MPAKKKKRPENLPSPELLQALQARYEQLNPRYTGRSAGLNAVTGRLYPRDGGASVTEPLYGTKGEVRDLSPRPGEYPLSIPVRVPQPGEAGVLQTRRPVMGPLTEEQQAAYEDQLDKEAWDMRHPMLF